MMVPAQLSTDQTRPMLDCSDDLLLRLALTAAN